MVKKIALLGLTGLPIPKEFEAKVKEDGRHWRVVLGELIDGLEDTHQSIPMEDYKEFSISEYDGNWYMKCNNTFYYRYNDGVGLRVGTMKVEDVDISEKWMIEPVGNLGMETVRYYTEPEVIDRDLNLYSW